MWNRPGQSEQEAMGPPSQSQPHPPHGSAHPPQPMQPVAQDKSSTSGETDNYWRDAHVAGWRQILLPLLLVILSLVCSELSLALEFQTGTQKSSSLHLDFFIAGRLRKESDRFFSSTEHSSFSSSFIISSTRTQQVGSTKAWACSRTCPNMCAHAKQRQRFESRWAVLPSLNSQWCYDRLRLCSRFLTLACRNHPLPF